MAGYKQLNFFQLAKRLDALKPDVKPMRYCVHWYDGKPVENRTCICSEENVTRIQLEWEDADEQTAKLF